MSTDLKMYSIHLWTQEGKNEWQMLVRLQRIIIRRRNMDEEPSTLMILTELTYGTICK